MKINSLKIKINILYYLVYGSLACISPFLTPYFLDRGLSFSQIGILFAVYSLVGVLAQPFWGVIADKYTNKKTTMIIIMTVSGICAFGFIASKDFYSILITILLFMFFQSPLLSVNDANTYDLMEDHRDIQYGKVRLMGSIGYAITSLGLGVIIKLTNIDLPFIAYFIFILMGLIILSNIKVKSRRTGSSINIGDFVKIIKDKRFILISFSAMLANIAFGAHGSYISVLMEETGGDVASIGAMWFVLAISELPGFFLEGKIMKKFGAINIYILGMILYIVRFLAISLCSNYQVVIAIQILQGITFPFYLTSTLKYVNDIVSPETRTTALTAFAALSGGVGGFIGNIGGGFLLQSISIFQLFRIFAVLSFLSLLIVLILKKVDRNGAVA